MKHLYLFIILVFLAGCREEPAFDRVIVEGLRPVYGTEADLVTGYMDARSFGELGKIVYVDPFILVNEKFKGIHLIDNTDPSQPIKTGFLQIPGNTEFTVKAGYLYANQGRSLKTFKIEGQQLIELNSLPSVFDGYFVDNLSSSLADTSIETLYPPEEYFGYFECVDPDAGIVLAWEETILNDPNCLR